MKGFNERQNCRKYSEKIITFPMKYFSKNAKHSSIISLKQLSRTKNSSYMNCLIHPMTISKLEVR